MIKEFGFTSPLLIDEGNMILAGHGRTMAATQLGFAELPVIILRGLSDSQKRAIVIADNQSSELASWDDNLLKLEIGELKKADFDLNLLGFPQLQMVEFLSGLGGGVQPLPVSAGAQDRDLTADEETAMQDAWRWLCKDWANILAKHIAAGHVSTTYTKGALAVMFLRARFFGYTIPSAASLAYTPHRIDVLGSGNKWSLVDIVTRCHERNDTIKSLRFVLQDQPKLDKLLVGTLAVQGGRLPGEFPADIARDLYDEFVTEPGGSVLDPCHGWGGRMLGFLLAKNAGHYEGYDTDPKTYRGVGDMFADLRKFAAMKKTVKLACEPFEDAKLSQGKFDFAMTSPPYFNVEKYGGDESSWKRYPEFDKWVAGFFAPMIKSVARALKPGACFALQVGNQSNPLEETAKTIADSCGLAYVETRHTDMINNYNKTDKDDGEVIVIFRKGKAAAADPAEKFGRVL